jgi:DNA-binding transcriptional ArsR family regulator
MAEPINGLDPAELAAHLGTLGNETRLMILRALISGGAMSTKELSAVCPGSINQHVRKLVDTGFVRRSKRAATKEGERQSDVYDVDQRKYKAVLKHMQAVMDVPKIVSQTA